MRFSIASLGEEPAQRFGPFVQLCELLGYDGFCHSDEKWTRDVYVRLAGAAAVTSRIGLGITVADPYTRHPALTAQATATLGEASGGRLRVFMGAGSHFETLPGYASVKPVVGIRESVQLMRRLWDGERVTLDGEVVKFAGGEFDFPVAPEHRPGLWVAGRGRQILRMAGEVADGVLIGSFATPPGIRYAKEHIAQGLERSGRDWGDVELASWLYVSVLDSQDDEVPAGLRRGVSHALWSSRSVANQLLENVDLSGKDEFLSFMKDAPHEWSPAVMAELRRLIPRAVIDQFAVVGTAEQVAAQLNQLAAEGVHECIAWPFPAAGMDVEDFAIQFAHEVIPRVRERKSRGSYRLVD